MDIADIITEFGAYYIKNDANMTRLYKQLTYTEKTASMLTPFFTDDTIYRASEARIARVLQPFQKAWTPISQAQFVPVQIEMFKMKIDSQEYPDDLEGTWLGFLAGDGIDRKQWPFIRWFVEVLLLPKAKEDYELYEIFKGVHANPTPGTAGAAGTTIDGLRKAINTQVTGGRITPITLGAVPTDPTDMVDYVEEFADGINKLYWDIPMQVAMTQANERLYKRGLRAKYGRDLDFTGTNAKIKETNLEVIGLPSMVGVGKIWCTPKENVLHLQKKTQNKQAIYIDSIDRLVKMFTDWWAGVGFIIPEIVFTNDVDLT